MILQLDSAIKGKMVPLKKCTLLDYRLRYTAFNWELISMSAELGMEVPLCFSMDADDCVKICACSVYLLSVRKKKRNGKELHATLVAPQKTV